MSKQLTMKVGVAMFAALALAGVLAIFAFSALQPVAAQTTSDHVTRSFSPTEVRPGRDCGCDDHYEHRLTCGCHGNVA